MAGHFSKIKRGFTLTELAIVLGIIGLILGAVWVASARVSQNNKAQLAVSQIQSIIQGYRSLFAAHQVDITDFTDITCMGVNSGFFPSDMVKPNTTCSTGSYTTYPQHPWGGPALVEAYKTWDGIVIYYSGLSQTACVQLAQRIFNAPELIQETLNNSARYFPPYGTDTPMTASQINSLCVNGNSNVVQIVYKAQ